MEFDLRIYTSRNCRQIDVTKVRLLTIRHVYRKLHITREQSAREMYEKFVTIIAFRLFQTIIFSNNYKDYVIIQNYSKNIKCFVLNIVLRINKGISLEPFQWSAPTTLQVRN
jgi:hypothetical protein